MEWGGLERVEPVAKSRRFRVQGLSLGLPTEPLWGAVVSSPPPLGIFT